MQSPITGKEMKAFRERRKLIFRKEEFYVLFHSYLCEDSGEKFESEEFAELNLMQVYNQYREKHKLPFPDEINSLREKYGLSASKMSEVLGFGVNTYRSYEYGEVPNTSNARLIQLVKDPSEFMQLVTISEALSSRESKLLEKRIDSLISENESVWHKIELLCLDTGEPARLNGYRRINLDKVINVVLFFTERIAPWKTKLNKLLFFADFLSFKKYCFSITGLSYRAIPLGPVPNSYDTIFDLMTNSKIIEKDYKVFDDGGVGERFFPSEATSFNPSLFEERELVILESIHDKFRDISTSDIIRLSHNEKGWIENQENSNLIDYYTGFDLINA